SSSASTKNSAIRLNSEAARVSARKTVRGNPKARELSPSLRRRTRHRPKPCRPICTSRSENSFGSELRDLREYAARGTVRDSSFLTLGSSTAPKGACGGAATLRLDDHHFRRLDERIGLNAALQSQIPRGLTRDDRGNHLPADV